MVGGNTKAPSVQPGFDYAIAEHPFQSASIDTLVILLQLVLHERDVEVLLTRCRSDWSASDGNARAAGRFTALAKRASADCEAAILLDDYCKGKLEALAPQSESTNVYDIACAWTTVRASMNVPKAAALLWRVSRALPYRYRKLESAIAHELKHLAARCFASHHLSRDGKLTAHRFSS
tara:strand:+ start:202 stop:735 length:534 start_codon:yes stop_codon:yes gene_type:complete